MRTKIIHLYRKSEIRIMCKRVVAVVDDHLFISLGIFKGGIRKPITYCISRAL